MRQKQALIISRNIPDHQKLIADIKQERLVYHSHYVTIIIDLSLFHMSFRIAGCIDRNTLFKNGMNGTHITFG